MYRFIPSKRFLTLLCALSTSFGDIRIKRTTRQTLDVNSSQTRAAVVKRAQTQFGKRAFSAYGPWCDDWWWWQMMNEVDGMRQEDYSKDWVMPIGKVMRQEDRWRWASDGDERWRTSATRRLNKDQVMEICRLSSRGSLVCERENLIFDTFDDC